MKFKKTITTGIFTSIMASTIAPTVAAAAETGQPEVTSEKTTIERRIAGENRYETSVAIAKSTNRQIKLAPATSPDGVVLSAKNANENFATVLSTPTLREHWVNELGRNRFDTSAKSVTEQKNSSNKMWVVSGWSNVDQLVASSAASKNKDTVLLVDGNNIFEHDSTIQAIKQKNPSEIIIVGGTGVVSTNVENQLKQFAPKVSRISGGDRYETAANVAQQTSGGQENVYIVNGVNEVDAIAAPALTSEFKGNILFTKTECIPQFSLNMAATLQPKHVFAIGGTGAVPQGEIPRCLTDAEIRKQNEETARQAAAVNPYGNTVKGIAYAMLPEFGFGYEQMAPLEALWTRESGWNTYAHNRGSGAYGIPQALPGRKMAAAGADWQTNPATQIRWGLSYIKSRYGTPAAAWNHFQKRNWY